MTTQEITPKSLTRQEQLTIWLLRHNMTQADIAKSTGATSTSVTRWFNSDTIPPYRHEQLTKLGIPAALLPPAEYKTGGRPAAN